MSGDTVRQIITGDVLIGPLRSDCPAFHRAIDGFHAQDNPEEAPHDMVVGDLIDEVSRLLVRRDAPRRG